MSGLDFRRSNPVEQCSIAIASAVVIRGDGLHVWVVTRWRAANAVTARRSRGGSQHRLRPTTIVRSRDGGRWWRVVRREFIAAKAVGNKRLLDGRSFRKRAS